MRRGAEMSFAIRQAWPDDLDRIVDLAVVCQGDPERACTYLSRDAAALRTELVEIDGADGWTAVTWVALDDARELVGWIAAEVDAEMGRVWWFGPFVADPTSPLADPVLDALLATGRRALDGVSEHELAIDARSALLRRFAERNGFVAQEGSAALRAPDLDVPVPTSAARIDVATAGEPDAVALHDRLFPGTHSPGAHLFGLADERHDRFVARLDDVVVGYVAAELQHDGSLYIDYLGVDPSFRGRGLGRVLVATAMRARRHEATHAHLTVRESNSTARQLYASLGFIEDVVIVPHRIGFTLD